MAKELDTVIEGERAGDYASQAYLEYAMSVVKGRALPDVADGQKPVQRRILYTMDRMGLAPKGKPVKSARVVGDVMGKLHPHGDQSIYDAMVRTAQNFSLRYPLVDGQGNFGSRDGDGAAAMRYTEATLHKNAMLLLSELDEGTVDFIPNYDGSGQEPKVLPARLPLLLANGASGIAVGMATEVPSHNLRELAAAAVWVLRNRDSGGGLTVQGLMEHLRGPDYPGGGQIVSSTKEIAQAYETGRGSLRVRARWIVENLARGQWRVIVYELPRSASTQKVLEEIEEVSNPQVKKDKKALSQEQLQQKNLMLSVLDKVRDESDKEHPVRLVLEPKSSKLSVDEMMAVLLANTSLETSEPTNLVAVDLDGRPRQMPMLTLLLQWCEFRVDIVRRRSEFRLRKAEDRIHILEGRRKVLLSIDKVIRLIRESDDPKDALIKAFGLSERQAEDILEIRLRQLARLEGIKIDEELAELQGKREGLLAILATPQSLQDQVIREIETDAKEFGDDRRTVIEEAQKVVLEASVVDEPVTVVISAKGWARMLKGHGIDQAGLTFKDGDSLLSLHECRTVDQLVLLLDDGRSCSVGVASLPLGKGDGKPLTAFIEIGSAKLVHALTGDAEDAFVIAKTSGYGFVCRFKDMLARPRAGKRFVTMEEGARLLAPAAAAGQTHIAVVSTDGRCLVFPLPELKELSGGKGVQLQGLPDGVNVAALRIGASAVFNLSGTTKSGKPKAESTSAVHEGSRARRGAVVLAGCSDLKFVP